MTKQFDKCEICGKNLKHITNLREITEFTCNFCGKGEMPTTICPDGHYICNECHAKDSNEVISKFCETTDLTDPFEIAEEIMKHPNFKVYGPEHHVLVPAAILTSLKNLKIKNPNGKEVNFGHVQEAIRRASKIPGGWCGFYGTCGSGAGAGVAISVFTKATPSKNEERSLSILTTSRSLEKIADNLEHCCKRSLRLAISEIINMLNEKFELNLDFTPKTCSFSSINDRCEKEKCLYFDIP